MLFVLINCNVSSWLVIKNLSKHPPQLSYTHGEMHLHMWGLTKEGARREDTALTKWSFYLCA